MADGVLALECQECTQTFDTIEAADNHLQTDEGCGRAQGFFCVVEVH